MSDNVRYDYTNQAWIEDGRYSNCGHPATMACGCYGRLHAGELAPIEPPIAGESDREYSTRIDAARVTWQFQDVIRPRKPQASPEDLPLFGGVRQGGLFGEAE
jgi:hypothetical protein